jgi:glycosyltransferase involved in cell wall biosynthesis
LKKKKISLLAIFAYTGYFGGERANYKVLQMMSELGVDVKFVLEEDCDTELLNVIQKNKKKYIKLKFGPQLIGLKNTIRGYISIVKHMLLVPYLLRKELKNGSYTHIYIPNYIQYFYVWLLLLFLKKYTVIFRIGDVPNVGVLHRIMWKYLINPNVSQFVTNSNRGYERLEENVGSVINKKCRVIRNTLISNFPVYIKKIPNIIFRVGYLGQMNAEKGCVQALKMVKKQCYEKQPISFIFAGEDKSNDKVISALIKSIQSDERCADKVSFLGMVDRPSVADFFLNIDVLIVPSLFEDSAPNVIYEAKFFGVPVIVFDSGGVAELIAHKEDGYICEGYDVGALTDGVEYYKNNKEILIQHSENSKKTYSKFSCNNIQREWGELLLGK